MKTARRISQIVFLVFFLLLFFQARYPFEKHLPVDLFLRSSPLVALSVTLASRSFIPALLPALIILLLTVPLGRFFCGWVCPLGTIIDGSDSVIKRKKRRVKQRESTRMRSWKFAILAAVLVGSLFSAQYIWFFDPIALLTRTLTIAIYPAVILLINGFFNFGFNSGILEDPLYSAYDFAQQLFLPVLQPRFHQAVFIFVLFLGILSLGLVSRRFWCRNLCPLGALLGIFSKFRLTKRVVSKECTECGICQRDCKMNAIEDDYTVNNTVECIECAECVSVCPPRAVSYTFGVSRGDNKIDLSRRRLIQAGIAAISGLAVIRVTASSRNQTGWMIRPPGAVPEDEFLDRCIRCQECTRICASTGNCLQPALIEGGLESMWTPVSVPRLGYCDYECNLCGQVCPTGAIQDLPLAEKQKIKIGTARFDKNRCIPWYSFKDCLVCEEHCPVSEKAIQFDIREVEVPDGGKRVVKFPYVVEDRCIGCGICENKCPLVGKPGIFVDTTNEERILPRV